MIWRQLADGRVECETHRKTFRVGHSCPSCLEEKPDDVAEAAETAMAAHGAAGLPTLIEHAKWFGGLSNRGAQIASEPSEEASIGEKARMFDVAIKAPRAAVELAEKRGELQSTDRLERGVKDLQASRDRTLRGTIH